MGLQVLEKRSQLVRSEVMFKCYSNWCVTESVAEYTRRPLLSITAADLGHESQAMERSLLRYFKDASDWGAIVLLDEADVYLEQRTMHDPSRNSIVSGKSLP